MSDTYGGTRTIPGDSTLPLGVIAFASLGAPIAWVMQLSVNYVLVAYACNTGWGGIKIALALVTALFAAVAVYAGIIAYSNWKRLPTDGDFLDSIGETETRGPFLMSVGVLTSGLFVLLIVLSGIPPLFVPVCAGQGV